MREGREGMKIQKYNDLGLKTNRLIKTIRISCSCGEECHPPCPGYIEIEDPIAAEKRKNRKLKATLTAKEREVDELRGVINFAAGVAKTFKEVRSSHVFFLIQQSLKNDELSWEEADAILDNIIAVCALRTAVEKPDIDISKIKPDYRFAESEEKFVEQELNAEKPCLKR